MIAFARRMSTWGVASLVLLLGECAIGEYNLHLYDQEHKSLFSSAMGFQFCVVIQLAAVVCGVIAMRRGSKWWAVVVVPATVLALGCYFGEL